MTTECAARRSVSVAQVYTRYDALTHPYLHTSEKYLRRCGVHLHVFSRAMKTSANGDAQQLACHSAARKLARLGVWLLKNPIETAKFLVNSGPRRIRARIGLWADTDALRIVKADVVHLMNWPMYIFLREYLAHTGTPFVLSLRGYETLYGLAENAAWRAFAGEAFERSAAIHSVSNFLAEAAIQCGAPREKVVVIRPSVDLELFGAMTPIATADTLNIATTCRLTWEKGIEVALLVVKELRKRGVSVRYHLIGDGTAACALQTWSKRLGLGESIVFHGEQPTAVVKQILRQCHIYLHPAVSEAFGVALVEAAATGIPCVAARVEGIPEVVIDGETGILCEFGDITGFADALERLWANEHRRYEMGLRAREWAEREFSGEREAMEWLELYTSIAERARLIRNQM